jgi:3',5'-nucleoside bisphosphate phosphatase
MIFRADLHIHTVLSPCGDLWMSPSRIVEKAVANKLNIIGIADHNSTLNVNITKHLAEKNNILVLGGAEITSREEVHCLCFMPNEYKLSEFQAYIDENISKIANDKKLLGYQLVVDEHEMILSEVEHSLLAATNIPLNKLRKDVADLGGIFIPAHINRSANSIESQLGFMPTDLLPDAIEVSKHIKPEQFLKNNQQYSNYPILRSSDAHYLENIGEVYTQIEMSELSFNAFKEALTNKKIIAYEYD